MPQDRRVPTQHGTESIMQKDGEKRQENLAGAKENSEEPGSQPESREEKHVRPLQERQRKTPITGITTGAERRKR
jgi:hypothetical protein